MTLASTKKAYIAEAKYQINMLKRLKRWLTYLILLSSLMIMSFFLTSTSVIHYIAMTIIVLCVIGIIILGLVIKKGQANVSKILQYADRG